jgi:hypothetical protein
MGKFMDRLSHAWNAFARPDLEVTNQFSYGSASFEGRPHVQRTNWTNERSIVSSILTRISIDVASATIRHVRVDDEDRFLEEIPSNLNNCLRVEANLDQAASAFLQDIAYTTLDKGVAAIVPVDTTLDPKVSGGYDINTMRVGRIINWYPRHIKAEVYNDHPDKGIREDITLAKSLVAIVENPLYPVMNEQNSMLQRLIRKLNLLDQVDEVAASGKLDMIIQLPYVIKSAARREAAEQRRKDIEFQLKGSQYGIAYTDGTEKITQLNRPAENNLLKEIEYLTAMVYGQLGLTEEVMNGTADEKVMLNYHNRTVEPILNAIVEAMRRSFLTKTARSQKQSILAYRDPFKLVPINDIAEIADKFTRNEILSSNEIRQFIGVRPSRDPKADQLRNSNMPQPTDTATQQNPADQPANGAADPVMQDAFASLNASLDGVFADLGVTNG